MFRDIMRQNKRRSANNLPQINVKELFVQQPELYNEFLQWKQRHNKDEDF